MNIEQNGTEIAIVLALVAATILLTNTRKVEDVVFKRLRIAIKGLLLLSVVLYFALRVMGVNP